MSNKFAICVFILSVFLSSVSQIMLKLSSQRKYDSLIKEYLNPIVIFAYGIFFSCTLITMYSLKVVQLSLAPILEATGFIFVAVLSRLFLKEHISKKKILGLSLIFIGIIICTL